MQLLADRVERLDTPARKPLYLATRARLRVRAEGESLVVSHHPTGCQRFPVARIDRIVCGSHADWSGEALALCLSRGITVTWVGPDGHAIGDCSPRLARPSGLHSALEIYLETPEWSCGYANWLRRERMEVLIRWAQRRLARGSAVERAEWEARKREFVFNSRLESRLPAELHVWCRARVVAQLAVAGLSRRYFGYDGAPLELAEDMTTLVWADLNLESGVLAAGTWEQQALALAFEAGVADRDRRLRHHLARLNLHVARSLDSWL